ncbi:sigma-54-dependent transcriptional regulator [Bacteroides graminisolvens]|uniref:sigma-54-dependent transcriptional regulator n=1 Tax=Bacteroides graminisolvens TaxID=477666 RepID=UPI00240A831C|nr:sigma-54 dependent transcriptional regulator [Bacteroides graminisolvens]
MNKVLIIEDNQVLSRMLSNWLEGKGIQVELTSSAVKAKKMIETTHIDIILSDIRLPDGDGVEILKWLKKQKIDIPFIVMTDYAEVRSAVRAMKLGAEDYLPKPIDMEYFYQTINNICHHRYTQHEDKEVIFERPSQEIREVKRRAGLVAQTNMSVLIQGENGTGKEYIAGFIHKESQRTNKPFVAVDCGSISKELAASEFFGHVKGSFTGATDNKNGVFDEAEGGTLFLDEIGNLPYEIQILLLRTLQERCYRPVGGKREIPANVRIVAATNENLEKAVKEGRFREDLYHRLNEFPLEVPPLRECREDILPLASFFLERACEEMNKKTIIGFEMEAQNILQSYSWPGNVRDLKNYIRKAVLLAEGTTIGVNELELDLSRSSDSLSLKSEDEEKKRIVKALQTAHYNKALAAELLQISRPTLYEKIKTYGISMKK